MDEEMEEDIEEVSDPVVIEHSTSNEDLQEVNKPSKSKLSFKEPVKIHAITQQHDGWDDLDNLLDDEDEEAKKNDDEEDGQMLDDSDDNLDESSFKTPRVSSQQMSQMHSHESSDLPDASMTKASTTMPSRSEVIDVSQSILIDQYTKDILSLSSKVESLSIRNEELQHSLKESSEITKQLQADLLLAQEENIQLQSVVKDKDHDHILSIESSSMQQTEQWKHIIQSLESELQHLKSENHELKECHLVLSDYKSKYEELSTKTSREDQINSLRHKIDEVKHIRVS